MPSPILARADALMQRRRQNAEVDDVPVLTDAVDINAPETDDDVPILFDIEPIAPLFTMDKTTASAAPAAASLPELELPAGDTSTDNTWQPAAALDAPDQTELPSVEELAREIARRVEARLAVELPLIIEATLRDFLAEQATDSQQADFQG